MFSKYFWQTKYLGFGVKISGNLGSDLLTSVAESTGDQPTAAMFAGTCFTNKTCQTGGHSAVINKLSETAPQTKRLCDEHFPYFRTLRCVLTVNINHYQLPVIEIREPVLL